MLTSCRSPGGTSDGGSRAVNQLPRCGVTGNERSDSVLAPITRIATMKKAGLLIPMLMIAGANAHAFETVARVTSVTPITETVNHPTRNCWTETEQVAQAPRHDPGGAILGTIAGGIIGSQIGKGNGRVAAAAVGAGI